MTENERFWSKVNKTESCWLWTGHTKFGYGQFDLWRNGKASAVTAHRYAYEALVGPLPRDRMRVLDHLCRVKHCVNPKHLQLVPQQINVLRGDVPRALRENRCINGHNYTPENIFINSKGVRVCKICMQAAKERRNARDRERRGPAPADRTHCPQGHPYDDENTYIGKNGSRSCRICGREKMRRRRAKP